MMLLFRDLYRSGIKDGKLTEEYFYNEIQKIEILGNELTLIHYSSSSQGASQLYKNMKDLL